MTKRSGHDKAQASRARSGAPAERIAELREIPLDQIQPPRQQARRFMGDIASLAASMQDYGLQQPISVRQDDDTFILTSGLRRLTAARMLRWRSIAAFVRGVGADDAYVIDLVENLQREDLSAEEEADALGELVRTRGWTLEQVAEAVKRSPAYVSKRVRLFEDPALRDAVLERELAVSTAELLLGVPAEHRSPIIERAIAERWDQMRVRDEMQSAQSLLSEQNEPRDGLPAGRPLALRTQRGAHDVSPLAARPPGLTRMIREFYRTILMIQAESLTPADRSALRTLFRALVMLARAQTTPTAPVFPPLPSPSASRSRMRMSTSKAARKR
jgi:ParB/RepB/Spo0J family partition protein